MVDCRKGDPYGKGLFIDYEEPIGYKLMDFEQEPTYDTGEDLEELVV